MSEIKQNTNLASEYFILSCLYRIGANAYLTLGNKKSVDIIIEKPNQLLTIDVKGLKDSSCFPIDNWTKKNKNHFIAFVTFNKKIADTSYNPEVYIVPSSELEKEFSELEGKSVIYINPKGNRKVVELSRLRKLAYMYKDNWAPFI